MAKWLVIRLCGWLAVLAAIGAVVCFIEYSRVFHSAGMLAVTSGLAVFAVLVGFAWFAGSALTWTLRRQSLTARARPSPARVLAQILPCPYCGQPARLVKCGAHDITTCFECLPNHDNAECWYIPVRSREGARSSPAIGSRAG